MKIVFAGSPQIGAIILEELVKEGFEIPLVLTKSTKPVGRGQKPTPTPVKVVAEKNKILTLSPAKLDSVDFVAKLKKVAAGLIIVAAYGRIFPKVILNLPKFGVLNFHPSLLPKFRGPSPIQFAILQGAKTTGVTIIKMSPNLDEGDIVVQKEIPIEKQDTTLTLKEKLAKLGAKMFIETIPAWCEGKITPVPQNHLEATYTSMLTKTDGKINLEAPLPPEKFGRMIRAFYPWPGVWCELKTKNEKPKIIKFLPDKPFLIQVEGKKPQTAKEFLNGYPGAREGLEKLGLV